jgi:hypothetical protein
LFCRGGAPTRNIDRLGGPVDAEHRVGRTDQRRGEQGHVTDSASDVEHVHARRQAGTPQHGLPEVAEERALALQPFEFGFRVAQWVETRTACSSLLCSYLASLKREADAHNGTVKMKGRAGEDRPRCPRRSA